MSRRTKLPTGTPVEKESSGVRRLALKLFAESAEQERFINALTAPQEFAQAIIWLNDRPKPTPLATEARLDWQPQYVDRLVGGQKPGRHPLHQAGAYYCLEFSSVFAASVFDGMKIRPQVVIDLCSSPGGKAIFAARSLAPQLLVCNEVIKKRTAQLIANLERCAIGRAVVTSCDPAVLSAALPQSAGLVIVDAPCSGQSLIARNKRAAGCFHPVIINKNARRQRRIIACAAAMIAPGGYLAYMTCTFAAQENEEIAAWLVKHFPHFKTLAVPALAAFQSRLAPFPCYRFWPQDGYGAGAFAALFQNQETGDSRPADLSALRILWPKI